MLKMAKAIFSSQSKLAKPFLVSKRNLLLHDPKTGKLIKPEPASCCGSGCQNCAWLKYADELLEYYKELDKKNEGISKILEEIDKLDDPNLKAYLKMEINFKIKS